MVSSLLNLVNNLSERIHRIKCKYRHDEKQFETWGFKYKYFDYFVEWTHFKDNQIEYKCLYCNKTYQHMFYENLKQRFFNTYKFSYHRNNKFVLLLQEGVYPYEYMNDCEKFNGISLIEKKDFYSHLNMEDITDVDYAHAKRVCKDSEIRQLRIIS